MRVNEKTFANEMIVVNGNMVAYGVMVVNWMMIVNGIYRKIPNISPGLIVIRKHIFEGLYLGEEAYIQGGLYSEGILC